MEITLTRRPDCQYHFETVVNYRPLRHSMLAWLQETYGPPGKEWDGHGAWIKIRSEEDATFFLLKWN